MPSAGLPLVGPTHRRSIVISADTTLLIDRLSLVEPVSKKRASSFGPGGPAGDQLAGVLLNKLPPAPAHSNDAAHARWPGTVRAERTASFQSCGQANFILLLCDGEFVAFTAEPNHSNALGGRPTFRETAAKRVMVAATRSCSHLTSLAVTGVLHQTGVERYWTFVL